MRLGGSGVDKRADRSRPAGAWHVVATAFAPLAASAGDDNRPAGFESVLAQVLRVGLATRADDFDRVNRWEAVENGTGLL